MNERLIQRGDRKLGHEWVEWDEQSAEYFPSDTSTPAYVWLILTPVILLLCLSAVFGILVGATILFRISPGVSEVIRVVFLGIAIFISLYFVLLGVAWFLKRDIVFFNQLRRLFAGITFAIGHFLHRLGVISRDRLGNSFVKVINRFYVFSDSMQDENDNLRILLLLPRCIERSVREKIIHRATEMRIQYAIAGDGASARQAVKRYNPKTILAIACERDLVTGIRDVSLNVSLFCLSVKRPVGPCKDTIVNLDELNEFFNHSKAKK